MEKMKRLRHATSGLCTVAGLKIETRWEGIDRERSLISTTQTGGRGGGVELGREGGWEEAGKT